MKPRRVFVFGCVKSLRFVGYILAYTSQKCHADVTWLKAMTLPRAYRFGTAPHLCTVGFLKLRWREGVQPSALALLLLPSVSLFFLFSVYQVAKATIKRPVPPDHPPPDWGSKKTKDSRNILPTSEIHCFMFFIAGKQNRCGPRARHQPARSACSHKYLARHAACASKCFFCFGGPYKGVLAHRGEYDEVASY